uniref:Mitochondrial inner membrane protease subunit 2 n=1 Tax=Compsopogon caeruleus TaxID=31354 RepID=A0A7S1THA8_9RHOD|mmetsp:Transcript_7594/g.15424  ORF Transcript_7594/g.15424 Transcript_7594/m.15424 type:complete len:101 (+) Transcript_7594:46-348(+)
MTHSSPNAPRERMVKRVLALPGDRVAPRNRPLRWNVVPPGHVWVEGDNSSRSNDSTEFGCIPVALVEGNVVAVIWPQPRRIQTTKPEHPRVVPNSGVRAP